MSNKSVQILSPVNIYNRDLLTRTRVALTPIEISHCDPLSPLNNNFDVVDRDFNSNRSSNSLRLMKRWIGYKTLGVTRTHPNLNSHVSLPKKMFLGL